MATLRRKWKKGLEGTNSNGGVGHAIEAVLGVGG